MKTRRKDIACESFAPRKHDVCTSVKPSLLSSDELDGRRRHGADNEADCDSLRPSGSSRYMILFNNKNNKIGSDNISTAIYRLAARSTNGFRIIYYYLFGSG